MNSPARRPSLAAGALVLALLGFASPGALQAFNGAQPVAINARAAGRAGVDSAEGDGALSQEVNPALVGRMPVRHADLGLHLVHDLTYYQTPTRYDVRGPDWIPLPAFAMAFGAQHDADGADRWRWGLSASPAVGGGGFAVASVGPSLSYRLRRGLHLGLGLRYLQSVRFAEEAKEEESPLRKVSWDDPRNPQPGGVVRVQATGAPLLINGRPLAYAELFNIGNDGVSSDPGGGLKLESTHAFGYGFVPILGLSAELGARTRLGLAYRERSRLSPMRGKARVDASGVLADIKSTLAENQGLVLSTFLPNGAADPSGSFDLTVSGVDLPRQAVLGLSHDLRDALRLSLEGRWLDWSSTMNDIRLRLSGGDNPDLIEINGGPLFEARMPMDWEDQYVASLGLEWSPRPELVLRAGHAYANNPVPDDTLNLGGGGFTEHHGTWGIGWSREAWDLDLAWVHAYESVVKSGHNRNDPFADHTRQKGYQDSLLLSFVRYF